MKIKVFDFFSGCGGTSAGLRSAGMQIVLGIDLNSDAAETYKKNFPEASFILGDIAKLRANKIKKYVAKFSDHPILFCGCAPCQPFSKQNGAAKARDTRTGLLKHFGRFVRYYLPDFVLVENVPGIQQAIKSDSPLAEFVALLKKLGYNPAELHSR